METDSLEKKTARDFKIYYIQMYETHEWREREKRLLLML